MTKYQMLMVCKGGIIEAADLGHHSETQMAGEGVEVAVVVEQVESALDAAGGN